MITRKRIRTLKDQVQTLRNLNFWSPGLNPVYRKFLVEMLLKIYGGRR